MKTPGKSFNRRSFIKGLGAGTAMLSAGSILPAFTSRMRVFHCSE